MKTSAEKMVDMADPTKHLPNVLSLVHDKIHAHASRNISTLVNRLTAMNEEDKYFFIFKKQFLTTKKKELLLFSFQLFL